MQNSSDLQQDIKPQAHDRFPYITWLFTAQLVKLDVHICLSFCLGACETAWAVWTPTCETARPLKCSSSVELVGDLVLVRRVMSCQPFRRQCGIAPYAWTHLQKTIVMLLLKCIGRQTYNSWRVGNVDCCVLDKNKLPFYFVTVSKRETFLKMGLWMEMGCMCKLCQNHLE